MEYAPAEYEKVENGMGIADFMSDAVENGAERVNNAAHDQELHSEVADRSRKISRSEDYHPAHCKIYESGYRLKSVDIDRVEDDPHRGQTPDHAEHGPSEGTPKTYQRIRSICARDEQENAAVVYDAWYIVDMQ